MPDSPLFPNFNKLIREQQAALRAWAKAQKSTSGPRQPMRYSSRGSGRPGGNWLWNSILSKLGDFGQVVDALLRPDGKNLAQDAIKELEAARVVLEAFGQDVSRPEATPAKILRELVDEGKPASTEADKRREDLDKGLRRTNVEPQRPQESPTPTEPLVEGMVPVRSSNVHSVGFEWPDSGTVGNLLVRFLGGDSKHRSGPGPLYRYFGVDRSVYLSFLRASSKGRAVWDDLRIRGTVSGHQYSYELAGLGDTDRVPRQAGLKRGQKGEFFLPRTFKGKRSNLPEQQVRGSRQPLIGNFRTNAKSLDFKRNGR